MDKSSSNSELDLRTTVIRQRLNRWYRGHHRKLPWRESRNPYHIWVSEVMLQQTQVKTVIPYFKRFLERFPTVADLAVSDLDTLLKQWEGLGYYSRARNFRKAAGIVIDEFNGKIPERWNDFIELPGVGEYIASAVLSIAFDQPFAVVDGNVKRVLARLDLVDEAVNGHAAKKAFQIIADHLLDRDNPGLHNQAVMELGALICKPTNPVCSICPLADHCQAFALDKTTEFPKRMKRKEVPTHQIAVGVIRDGDRLLITRRKAEGLLGGLWEFPGGKIGPDENPVEACIREIREETGLQVEIESPLAKVKHAYTHFKIEMTVYACTRRDGEVVLNGPVDHRWIRPEEIERFPFPGANHKFLDRVRAYCSALAGRKMD